MSTPTFGNFDPDRLLIDAEALATAGRERLAPNGREFGEVDGRGLLLTLADMLHQVRCLFAAADEDLAERSRSEGQAGSGPTATAAFPEVYRVIEWLISDDGLAWTEAECARAAAVAGLVELPDSSRAGALIPDDSSSEEDSLR